jgi:uncharacterized protein (UPF0297 family)
MAQKITLSELKKIVKKTLKEETDSVLKSIWGYNYSVDGLYADYEKEKKAYIKKLEKDFEHMDQMVESLLEEVQECENTMSELKSIVNNGNYLMSDYRYLEEKFIKMIEETRFALVDIVIEDSSPANSIKNINMNQEKLRQFRKKIEGEIEYGTPSED